MESGAGDRPRTRLRAWWQGRRRWQRVVIAAAACMLVVALAGFVAVGYLFSNQLLDNSPFEPDFNV